MSFRIDDTGAAFCRVVGYEQMTDVSTGTGEFPTAAQKAGGGYIAKSSNANATAVKWFVIADGRSIVLSIAPNTAVVPGEMGAQNRFIGDIIPTRPGGDPYAFVLGYSAEATYYNANGLIDQPLVSQAMPRAYHGLGGSVLHSCYPYTGSRNSNYSGADPTLGSFPSEVDGGMRLSKRCISGASAAVRGDLPGVYSIPQSNVGSVFSSGSIINGTGDLAGRHLLGLSSGGFGSSVPSAAIGLLLVDITGPWR